MSEEEEKAVAAAELAQNEESRKQWLSYHMEAGEYEKARSLVVDEAEVHI